MFDMPEAPPKPSPDLPPPVAGALIGGLVWFASFNAVIMADPYFMLTAWVYAVAPGFVVAGAIVALALKRGFVRSTVL